MPRLQTLNWDRRVYDAGPSPPLDFTFNIVTTEVNVAVIQYRLLIYAQVKNAVRRKYKMQSKLSTFLLNGTHMTNLFISVY